MATLVTAGRDASRSAESHVQTTSPTAVQPTTIPAANRTRRASRTSVGATATPGVLEASPAGLLIDPAALPSAGDGVELADAVPKAASGLAARRKSSGGCQPGGGAISTMPPHFGQA